MCWHKADQQLGIPSVASRLSHSCPGDLNEVGHSQLLQTFLRASLTQRAQLLLIFDVNFCGSACQYRNKMQHLNHANTTPNSQNIKYMLPFYLDISHFNCLTQWSSGYPLKLLHTVYKYLMTPALTGEPIFQYFPSYHEGSMSFFPCSHQGIPLISLGLHRTRCTFSEWFWRTTKGKQVQKHTSK